MSATITLLRLNVRLLQWPILAVLLALLVAFLLSTLTDILGVEYIITLAAVISTWIASAWIFGAEYDEGARDYLTRRPVHPLSVLWTKLAVLVPFVLCCSIAVGLSFAAHVMVPITVAFLCLSLSTAAMTVVFQDMVRGLLIGPVICAVPPIVWRLLESYLTKRSIMVYPEGVTTAVEPSFPWPSLSPIHIIPIPFVLVLCLYMVYMSVVKRRPLQRSLFACFLICLSFLSVLVLIQVRHEGKAALYRIDNIGPSPYVVNQGRLRYVAVDNHEIRLHSLELDDLHATPTDSVLSELSKEENPPTGIPWVGIGALRGDRLVILHDLQNELTKERYSRVDLFSVPTEGGEARSLFSTRCKPGMKLLEGNRLLLHKEDGQPLVLNLHSVEVSDATLDVSPLTLAPTSTEMSPLPGFSPDRQARDGRLVAALPGSLDDLRLWMTPPFDRPIHAEIRLFEVTKAAPPKPVTSIPIPDNFWSVRSPNPFAADTPSEDSVNEVGNCLFLKMGGQYLFLYFGFLQRVAVWDISDLSSIRYIGIAPTPKGMWNQGLWPLVQSQNADDHTSVSPYRRPDGALGFMFFGKGILWLEFPALMKEAKS